MVGSEHSSHPGLHQGESSSVLWSLWSFDVTSSSAPSKLSFVTEPLANPFSSYDPTGPMKRPHSWKVRGSPLCSLFTFYADLDQRRTEGIYAEYCDAGSSHFSPSFHSYPNPQTTITMSQTSTQRSTVVSFAPVVIKHGPPTFAELTSLDQGIHAAQSERSR